MAQNGRKGENTGSDSTVHHPAHSSVDSAWLKRRLSFVDEATEDEDNAIAGISILSLLAKVNGFINGSTSALNT